MKVEVYKNLHTIIYLITYRIYHIIPFRKEV